ncbi:DNA cytosine methyltransferase [Streptomyces sp. NPDC059916]|uniref:DNA cytosine methyltransferase n=1 Tax=Streptomyces sp. NPDC059916 TaxID=3347001 RepID=UPI0036C7C9E5
MTQRSDIRRALASPPRIIGLCAGYGGLEAAVRARIGGQVVAFAENDPYAATVYAHRHPDVPNIGDITRADWERTRLLYRPDVVCAGFPCRNISNAGRRDGINGQWSRVWKNVAQAVGVLRPRLVFLENVAALRSRGLDVVAADLAALGYDVRWTCLRAGGAEVGAPHPRDRWFAVAYPADAAPDHSGRYRWAGHEPQPQGRDEPAHRRHEVAFADDLTLLPTPRPAGGGNLLETGDAMALLSTPTVADARGTRNFTARRTPGKRFSAGKTLTDIAWLLPTPKASDGPRGGPNQRDKAGNYYLPGIAVRLDSDWVSVDGIDYGPAIRRWQTIIGRPAPEPTEPGTRGNRRLTSAFVEWMMGLPAGWVTDVPDIPRREQLKILGNGVVPQQACHAYGWLLGATAAGPTTGMAA